MECFICFEETSNKQYLIYCINCKKICHYKCYYTWWDKNEKKEKMCLHCQQQKVLQLKYPWYLICFDKIFGIKVF